MWVVLDHPYIRKKREGLHDFVIVFEVKLTRNHSLSQLPLK